MMWSAHELHGVFDMAPLSGLLGLSLAFAGHGIPGRPGDRLEAVLLNHLPRDRVNLRLGYHVALPCSARRNRGGIRRGAFRTHSTSNCASGSIVARIDRRNTSLSHLRSSYRWHRWTAPLANPSQPATPPVLEIAKPLKAQPK